MKKLIAFILIAASIFCLASCGDEEETVDGVAKFSAMYAASAPTKVLTNHIVSVGGVDFTGTSSLVTGVTTAGKKATVQIYEYETIQPVDAGAGDIVTPVTGTPIKGSREYLEGRGERIDGGGWDSEGYDFAPVPGSIALNLNEANLTNVSYSENNGTHSLMFTVPAANAAKVFGAAYSITSDATVVISGNGAVVTGVTVSYSMDILSDDEEVVYPSAEVTITTTYSYVLEQVTLVK